MSQATVKTVQYVDPRIEPQPDPVYDYVIGPTQNQYYKIPASGKSNSNLTFNNLTTLGVDRAYLDTFEIELGVTIQFNLSPLGKKDIKAAGDTDVPVPFAGFTPTEQSAIVPAPDEWTFQSFPFNTCCDEARVNINGGAFFSQPMCYIRAKERYMDQWELSKSYENVCPIHKPICQTESGRNFNSAYTSGQSEIYNTPTWYIDPDGTIPYASRLATGSNAFGVPTRLGAGMFNFMQSDQGLSGGYNNSIVRLGSPKYDGNNKQIGWTNYYYDSAKNATIVKVVWREPLFVSPFSSRYDATYGRPLYNITSMDFAFNLMNLGNMIRLANLHHFGGGKYVTDYSINIDTANLCYQVMTIPPIIQKPLSTLVPYRRFVPYITEYNSKTGAGAYDDEAVNVIGPNGAKHIEILSGVYTLNEIPTAIWVFCAPTKDLYQNNPQDVPPEALISEDNMLSRGCWESNKLFAYMRHVNISLANTTQILNTAEPLDLYRIAKANGCQDSYLSWGVDDAVLPKCFAPALEENGVSIVQKMYYGAGSVLRLKPGVDIIIPDVPLIPGANANNMVLQVRADFAVPPHSPNLNKYALWLLFEYVGVASISPGQCEITMNPLGTGEIMAVSPVMSATSASTEGVVEGSGFWDKAKTAARIAQQIADSGAISKILAAVPGGEKAQKWAESHGMGAPVGKKRCRGGAVMGRGLNEWI